MNLLGRIFGGGSAEKGGQAGNIGGESVDQSAVDRIKSQLPAGYEAPSSHLLRCSEAFSLGLESIEGSDKPVSKQVYHQALGTYVGGIHSVDRKDQKPWTGRFDRGYRDEVPHERKIVDGKSVPMTDQEKFEQMMRARVSNLGNFYEVIDAFDRSEAAKTESIVNPRGASSDSRIWGDESKHHNVLGQETDAHGNVLHPGNHW
jgi:hypothetical protein